MAARMRGMGPGCCCTNVATTCTITVTDNLADYTQVTGTWTKPASVIQTTSANALIVNNTPHPEGSSTGRVFAQVSLPTTGKVRLLFAYQSPNKYLFLEMEVNAALPNIISRIGKRSGGADTILETVYGTSASTTLSQLCYNGTRLSSAGGINATDAGLNYSVTGLDSPLTGNFGTQIGFQAIGITGTASFSGVTFHGIDDPSTCVSCRSACQTCDVSGTPGELSLYIDGVVSDSLCATCEADYNGVTFILENEVAATSTRTCYFKTNGVPCNTLPGNDYHDFVFSNFTGNQNVAIARLIGDDGGFVFTRTNDVCDAVLTKVGGYNQWGVGNPSQICRWDLATAVLTPNMA